MSSRILIIDDDAELCTELAEILMGLRGFEQGALRIDGAPLPRQWRCSWSVRNSAMPKSCAQRVLSNR